MFRPNQSCVIYTSVVNDVYGKPSLGGPVRERCTVTTTLISAVKSAVRADTSATRGNAREINIDATVLMVKNTKARIDDILEVDGVKMRITGMIRRQDLQGNTDHYEVTGTYWSN